MKSNLAILSSDQKSIDFIKKNKLSNTLNLYANSSRNTEAAQVFCKSHNFNKYYGSYEDLIYDKEVDFILNFLPSGIKFEYIYLCLKNNIKVITDYPIISSSNDLGYFNELAESKLINNLFSILFEIMYTKKLIMMFFIKKRVTLFISLLLLGVIGCAFLLSYNFSENINSNSSNIFSNFWIFIS